MNKKTRLKDHEILMERMMQLTGEASIRMRDSRFPDAARWWVDIRNVARGSLWSFGSFGGQGSTPEEAIRATWEEILKISQGSEWFLLCFNCRDDEPFGSGPNAWVQWNEESESWQDVTFSAAQLQSCQISCDELQPHAEFIRDIKDAQWSMNENSSAVLLTPDGGVEVVREEGAPSATVH